MRANHNPEQSPKQLKSEPAESWFEWRKEPTKKQFYYKLAICATIYMLVWMVFQSSSSYAVVAEYHVRRWMSISYDFTKASNWYTSHIGDWQTFLPAFLHDEQASKMSNYSKPVTGVVMRPYSVDVKGVWISTNPGQVVAVIGTGLVSSVQETKETGLTVVVRHADGVESIYGWLVQVNVKTKDWLNPGDIVGAVKLDAVSGTGKLYLAIKKNHTFIDPGDVIPLD